MLLRRGNIMKRAVALLLASAMLLGCTERTVKSAIAKEYNNSDTVEFDDFYLKKSDVGNWYVWRAKINAMTDLGRRSGFLDTCGSYTPGPSSFVLIHQHNTVLEGQIMSCDDVVDALSRGNAHLESSS